MIHCKVLGRSTDLTHYPLYPKVIVSCRNKGVLGTLATNASGRFKYKDKTSVRVRNLTMLYVNFSLKVDPIELLLEKLS